MKPNENIRQAMKSAGIRQWEVAGAIGVSEQTLIRWLRYPLPTDREEKILSSIDALKQEVS